MSKAHDQRYESDSRAAYNFCREIGIIRESDDDTKRHEYKQLAEEMGLYTSHEKAGFVPWTNSKTIQKGLAVVKDFRHYARVNGFGENLRTLPKDAATAFFNHKLLDDGVSRSRLSDIVSVISKVGQFAERAGFSSCRGYTDSATQYRNDVIKEIPRLPAVSRGFDNPAAVIDRLKPPAALAAEIQLRTGLRAENACSFKINPDGVTVSLISKGGQHHDNFAMPADLISRAREFADVSGNVRILSYGSYAYQVGRASQYCGERIDLGNGKTKLINTHGFRHNFGKNLYNDLLAKGVPAPQAKAEVSEALFHKRLDVVSIYIR